MAEVCWHFVSPYCAIAYQEGDTKMHAKKRLACLVVVDPDTMHDCVMAINATFERPERPARAPTSTEEEGVRTGP